MELKMPDLNDIYLRLGAIQADVKSIRDDITGLKTDLSTVEEKVQEVRDFKVRMMAWATAVAAGVTMIVSLAKAVLASSLDHGGSV